MLVQTRRGFDEKSAARDASPVEHHASQRRYVLAQLVRVLSLARIVVGAGPCSELKYFGPKLKCRRFELLPLLHGVGVRDGFDERLRRVDERRAVSKWLIRRTEQLRICLGRICPWKRENYAVHRILVDGLGNGRCL